jgi:hypothetical protein
MKVGVYLVVTECFADDGLHSRLSDTTRNTYYSIPRSCMLQLVNVFPEVVVVVGRRANSYARLLILNAGPFLGHAKSNVSHCDSRI